ILLDSYAGAINRVHPNATAFVHRNALFCIQYLTYNWGSAWLAQTRAAMRPFASGFCYQNYIDPTLRNWQHAYYGSNYRRLLAVRVDLHHDALLTPQDVDGPAGDPDVDLREREPERLAELEERDLDRATGARETRLVALQGLPQLRASRAPATKQLTDLLDV